MQKKKLIGKTTRHIAEISSKDVYWQLMMEMTKRPNSEEKWREKTDVQLTNEEWTTIYTHK